MRGNVESGDRHARTTEPDEGITRRQVIHKVAVVAGTVWAVPVVQVVTMQPAFAQTTSGTTETTTPSNGEPPNGGETPPDGGQQPPGGGETSPVGGQQPVDGAKAPTVADPGDTEVLAAQIVQPGSTQTPQSVVAALQETPETIPKTGIESIGIAALGAGLVAAGGITVRAAGNSDPDKLHEASEPPEGTKPTNQG